MYSVARVSKTDIYYCISKEGKKKTVGEKRRLRVDADPLPESPLMPTGFFTGARARLRAITQLPTPGTV